MRTFLAILLVSCSAQAFAQSDVMRGLVEEMNAQIEHPTPLPEDTISAWKNAAGSMRSPPQWGVAVRDRSGKIVDYFGQVPYSVTPTGEVTVPGFQLPPGSKLEVIPAGKAATLASASGNDWNKMVAPLADLPAVVVQATDFLAEKLCSNRGRPSSITLTLVVGASGNILFAEASTEAGSEVTWDLANDTCKRYGDATPQ